MGLYAAVIALVIGFGSSQALASAYGIAVTGTLAIDTILFAVVVRVLWKKPLRVAIATAVAFLIVDLAFFAANVPKVVHGGWFPLTIAFIIFTVLITWQHGREIVTRNRTDLEGPLQAFVDYLHDMEPPLYRTPGTAVFLNPGKQTAPLAMRANVEHNRTLHEEVVILSIETMKVPHVPREEQLQVDDLGYRDDGITHLTARFGFQDDPNVPDVLRMADEREMLECDIDVDSCSYFLSQITIVRTNDPGMARWRKKLFLSVAKLSSNPVEYFGLPIERTVTMGQHIDL
jgi:KUP system potassium uptake protein